MYKSINALVLGGLLLLTACGGGSSSGGGSTERYTGTFSLTAVSPAKASGSGTFKAFIGGSSITIEFDDGTVFSGNFNAADLAVLNASIVGAVEGCTSGTFSILVGRPDGSTIRGTIISKDVVCEGIVLEFVGSLEGSRTQ